MIHLTVKKRLIFTLGALAALAMLVSPTAMRTSSPSNQASLLRLDEAPAQGAPDVKALGQVDRGARALLNLVLVETATERDAERGERQGAHFSVRTATGEMNDWATPSSASDDQAPDGTDAARRTLHILLAALVAAVVGMSIKRRLVGGARCLLPRCQPCLRAHGAHSRLAGAGCNVGCCADR